MGWISWGWGRVFTVNTRVPVWLGIPSNVNETDKVSRLRTRGVYKKNDEFSGPFSVPSLRPGDCILKE